VLAPYSFTHEQYVHPRIVEELVGWLSDSAAAITSIDLRAGNDSNRFFGAFEIRTGGDGTWVEQRHADGGYFAYRHVATTPAGTHILRCAWSGGGTGTFNSILLVAVEADTVLDGSAKRFRTRLLLRSVGSIGLGDRYAGRVTYGNGVLRVGADENPRRFGGRVAPQSIPID
jgi:hypothetical protein